MMVNCRCKYQAANPACILAKYMRETSDCSILEEVTPYAHTDGQKTDTIYDHVIEGLEFLLAQFSDRGLPLILKADGTTRWTTWGISTGAIRPGSPVGPSSATAPAGASGPSAAGTGGIGRTRSCTG
jgi:hypothetical protein